MNLSKQHQETFDEYFPDGYVPQKVTMLDGTVVADEADYFHIMFIDIINPGKNPRHVPCMQKYSVQDWTNTKNIIEGKNPRVQADIHVTGHDEYAVIHDPVKAKAEKAKAEAGAKEAEEKKAKAAEAKKKAEAMRAAKAEKAEKK